MLHFESFGDFGFAAAVTLAVIAASYTYFKYRTARYNEKLPPTMTVSFKTFVDSFVSGQVHRLHLKLCADAPVYRVPFLFSNLVFLIADPSAAKILIEGDSNLGIPESDKSNRYDSLAKLTKGVQSMLTRRTHDDVWEISRKSVSHSFSNTNLYKVLPELQVKLDQLNGILDNHIVENKMLMNLPDWMIRVTMDVFAAGMFSADFRTLESHSSGEDIDSEGQNFIRNVLTMSKEYVLRGTLAPWRKYQFWDKTIMKEIAEADDAARAVENLGKRVLEEYRRKHTEEELQEDKSILAHLIRSPYPSDKERIADVSIFMIAGHDTTAYQLSWIIIELSRHPECVLKLRAELDAIFPREKNSSVEGDLLGDGNKIGEDEDGDEKGRDKVVFTPQQFSKLTYLSMVIKEGMRLWPVTAVGTSRIAAADIPCNGKIIPKGSTASVSFFAMFRLCKIREPESFIPDRWMDSDPEYNILKEIAFPFSTGKRACVGQNLALLELKLVLANLFYFYDFELVGEVTEMYYTTVKPQNANFKISKRVF